METNYSSIFSKNLKSREWGAEILYKVYRTTNHLYNVDQIDKDYNLEDNQITKLNDEIGFQFEEAINKEFVPSFFSLNLLKKDSLAGRVSSLLFFLGKKTGLDKKFQKFNASSKLVSVVFQAEKCWLDYLFNSFSTETGAFDRYEGTSVRAIIRNGFRRAVSQQGSGFGENVTNPEISKRVTQLMALNNTFYKTHHQSASTITEKTQLYLNEIFNNSKLK